MPDIPEGSVVITPAEVYGKVVTLTEKVTELVAKQEAEKIPERLNAVSADVDKLKQFKWILMGAIAASGPAWSAISSQLAK